ncbi:Xenin [Dactylellina cionopaga]|nr:Xenin [Dactylellina cionopaga]
MIWDANTGTLLHRLEGHIDSVVNIIFTPDGNSVISADHSNIMIWDLANGALLKIHEGSWAFAKDIIFSNDNKLFASLSDERVVKAWKPSAQTAMVTFPVLNLSVLNITDDISPITMARDGKTVAIPGYQFAARIRENASVSVRLCDTDTGDLLETFALEGQCDSVNAMTFLPCGEILALVGEKASRTISLWNLNLRVNLQTFEGDLDPFETAAISPDGMLIALVSNEKIIRLWESSTGVEIRALEHQTPVIATAFSPDSTLIASLVLGGVVELWDASTGASLQKMIQYEGPSRGAIAFSRDGKILATASKRNVSIWDLATGSLQRFKGQWDLPKAVAFGPDGQVIVFGTDSRAVMLRDLSTAAPLQMLLAETPFSRAAFSPDGSLIISDVGRSQKSTTPEYFGIGYECTILA